MTASSFALASVWHNVGGYMHDWARWLLRIRGVGLEECETAVVCRAELGHGGFGVWGGQEAVVVVGRSVSKG